MSGTAGPGVLPDHLERVIEQSHSALDAFFRGDARPAMELFSPDDDVSLANPFGPPVRGFGTVVATAQRAATHYSDGRALGFERVAGYVTPALAYIVELEHYEAKVGGRDEVTPVSLRVTTILRPEGDTWRIVHRHADAITSSRSPDTVLDKP